MNSKEFDRLLCTQIKMQLMCVGIVLKTHGVYFDYLHITKCVYLHVIYIKVIKTLKVGNDEYFVCNMFCM